MKSSILKAIALIVVCIYGCNTNGNYNNAGQSTTSREEKSLLHDSLRHYINDACRKDTRIMMDVVNALFTTQKYEQISSDQKNLEKVIHEDGKTIYRFNFQNSIKMLVIKEGNETKSLSITCDIYDAFARMSLAIIEMSRDSVQIMYKRSGCRRCFIFK